MTPEARGGTFADILERRGAALRKPSRVVELPLSCWADERPDKPAAPVPIGLRVPAELDLQRAEDEAAKAVEMFASHGERDDRIRAFNDALIREILAAATCQPMDVTQAWFEMGAHDIGARLTSEGIKRLYNEYEILRVGSDASMPEIDDEGFAHLVVTHDRAIGLEHLPPEDARLCKRLLEAARQLLVEGEVRAERSGVAILGGSDEREVPAADPAVQELFEALEKRLAPASG